VREYFSTDLRNEISTNSMQSMLAGLEEKGGADLYVMAAAALPGEEGSAWETALVGLQFERLEADMRLSWQGKLEEGALKAFTIGPRVRELPAAAPQPEQVFTYRRPEYVDPEAFRESETVLPIRGGDLPIRLTMPLSATPHEPVPLVLLMGDLSMDDLEGTVGPNQILTDLAQGLASRGIAVARISWSDMQDGTLQQQILARAQPALQLLVTQPGIDPVNVYVAGLGVGGNAMIPLVQQLPRLRGVIILGSPWRYDVDYLSWRLAKEPETLGITGELQRERLAGKLYALRENQLSENETIAGASAEFWTSASAIEPAPVFSEWQGKALYLTPARSHLHRQQDWQAWSQLLSQRRGSAAVLLDDLNHWFLPGREEPHPAEYRIPSHVSPKVLRAIEQFIKWNPGAQ
jgi:acetyl esterase/lipase